MKVKRFLALFLTIIMLLATLASCTPASVLGIPFLLMLSDTEETTDNITIEVTTPEPEVTTPEVTTPEVTTPEVTTPEVTTPEVTTPEVTTPEETTPEETTPEWMSHITPDGRLTLTHVTITAGDSPAELTAVSELTSYLEKRSITVGEGGFPIDIYIDYSLDEDAYCVEADFYGNYPGMDIRGGNGRGVLYGVYGFLEKYAGLRAFTPYLEVYPTEGDILIEEGKMIEYCPVFQMRVNDWYKWVPNQYRYPWCVKNGVNMVDGWWNAWDESLGGAWDYGNLFVHTLGALSEYDANKDGVANGYDRNPCLSLDKPEGQANLANVIKNVKAQLNKVPTATIISVSQNDTDQCRCDNCLAWDAYYGSPSGTILAFVNEVAKAIATEYPHVTIDTLAYAYSQTPPQNIVPEPNVCIRLCSITCCFTHPLNDPSCPANAKFCRDLEGWSAICDNIHIWDYATNFAFYIPTYATLHVLQENMQFFAEHNARGMFPQGNRNGPSGEFGELRAYLLSKLMMNPYMGEDEYYRLMDEFLQAYYGDGWAYIRMYIDKTSEIFEDYCGDIYMHPLARVPAEEFIAQMQSFTDWWDKAEAMADEAHKDNVHRSSLQWRWFLARFDKTLQPAFEEEIKKYGIWWSEGNQHNSKW